MSKHAFLSPSGSHRWLNCTPSAMLESEFPDGSSSAADEGTAAHAFCEHKLKKAFRRRSKRPVSDYDSDEMQEYTDSYVDYVLEQFEVAKQTCKDPMVLIEQKVDFSEYVQDGYGTADCIIVSDDALQIIDFKYGLGVLEDAEQNTQLMCYSIGALNIFDSLYDIKEVTMHIFQPRRENVQSWTIPVDELKAWAENELKPKAQMALNGEGEYHPGEWCQFCKAAVRCRARAEEKLRLAQQEFKMPSLLTDAEIEEGVAKFGGKKPNKAAIKLPLRDGDIERDDEAYKGHYFINANSTTPPQIVDKYVKPILDRNEVYSGYYARVSLNFYAFNSNGNKGAACGLGNLQKIRDGESLGGRSSATDDFSTVADDDFLS